MSMNRDIATISYTKEILDKYHLSANKKYGQNFIIDNNIVKKIVDLSNIDSNTNVIEIGPGIGALSEMIAKKCNKLICIEIDQRLKEVLSDTLSNYNNIDIIFDDFLKIDLDKLIKNNFDNKEIVIISNLPYYITTAILIKIFENNPNNRIKSIYAMMQKEVGMRLSASINSKDYNSLTILTNYYCNTKIIINIPKNIFIPRPNVDSVVVSFIFKDNKEKPENETIFFNLIRVLFKQRRKTILNNLNILIKDKDLCSKILLDNNLSSNLRAENLSINDFITLSNYLNREGFCD